MRNVRYFLYDMIFCMIWYFFEDKYSGHNQEFQSHDKKTSTRKLSPQAGVVSAGWLPLVHITEYILPAFSVYRCQRQLFREEIPGADTNVYKTLVTLRHRENNSIQFIFLFLSSYCHQYLECRGYIRHTDILFRRSNGVLFQFPFKYFFFSEYTGTLHL